MFNIAKNTVLGVLRDSETQRIKSFSFGGVGFDAKTFPVLAGFIDRDKITVEYDDNQNGSAAYDYAANKILLGFRWTLDYVKDALIVHECTHAVYDVAQTKMSNAVSESIAYVVQCQYLLIKNDNGKRLTSPNKAKDLVFEIAWSIALKIQKGESVSSSEKHSLQDAVSKHPFYMAKSAADAGFDGV